MNLKMNFFTVPKYTVTYYCLLLYLSKNSIGRPNHDHLVEHQTSDLEDEIGEVPESPYPTYPFQQYIQVRKTYSVEHLPAYSSSSSGDSLQPSASHQTDASDSQKNSHNYDDDNNNHYHGEYDGTHYGSHKPLLTEEILTHKKQEVYEEKGYGDSSFDHEAYGGGGGKRVTMEPSHHHYGNEHYNSDATHVRNRHHPSYRTSPSIHSKDGTSTKILEYAANNLYDRAAHEKGIYKARKGIYCPPMIDFDLSSKSMAMGQGGSRPRGSKPRLKGLGSKISCMKNKYFGPEPLPSAIFPEPSESKHTVIPFPTFEQFVRAIKTDSTFNW